MTVCLLFAARGLPVYNKVYLNANRLTIDGTSYTGDNMKNLPDDINPCYISQRSSENIVCFGGRLSRFNPLSNFYETPFTHDRIRFSSSEQALQHAKAVKFGDTSRTQLILNSSDCNEQERLGRHVTDFNQAVWNAVKIRTLTDILTSKFSQNAKSICAIQNPEQLEKHL